MNLDSIASVKRRLDERLQEARDLALAGTAGQDPGGQDPGGQDPGGQDPGGQDPGGQDPAWDAYLRSQGLKPLTPERRQEILNSGMDHAKGVLPAEFRLALVALRELSHVEHRRLPKGGDTSEAFLEAREILGNRLETFVADEMKRYLEDVRPAVSVMSIFANAMKTTVKQREVADAVNTLSCPTCGAARLKELSQGECGYCGYDFKLLEG